MERVKKGELGLRKYGRIRKYCSASPAESPDWFLDHTGVVEVKPNSRSE